MPSYKSLSPEDPRLRYLTLELAAEPPEGVCYCYRNRYWLIHPDKGLIFFKITGDSRRGKGIPQCYAQREFAENQRDTFYPWAEVVQLSVAIVSADPRDYM